MEKIKTGIASFGLSGQVFHAPFLDVHEGFELSVIAERSNNLARGAYPGVQVVRSFDDLLATDIELVVVNTPGQTHADYCRQALEAGKHVVVEKTVRTHLCRSTSIDPVGRGKRPAADGFSKPTLRRGFSDRQTNPAIGRVGPHRRIPIRIPALPARYGRSTGPLAGRTVTR